MASVTATNGQSYHLWGLPDLSAPTPTDTTRISTLQNELGDGYRTSLLVGSNNGLKEWKITLPTLAGSGIPVPTLTDVNGATVTREQYIRSLYIENKVTGTPFVYTDPASGQYYLVDFAEDDLSMERMKVKIFSTGITLRQRRITGVSVFQVAEMFGTQPATWLVSPTLTDSGGSPALLYLTGDVLEDSTTGFDVWRLNSVSNTGLLKQGLAGSLTIWDIFIVMKVREATFGQTSGVLTGTTEQFLIGTSGGTTFTNLGISSYEYRYNGDLLSIGSQTAPMNTWGLVHQRFAVGRTITAPQFGQDRTVGTSTKAEIDIAEIVYFAGDASVGQLPMYLARQLTEHLLVKYTAIIGV